MTVDRAELLARFDAYGGVSIVGFLTEVVATLIEKDVLTLDDFDTMVAAVAAADNPSTAPEDETLDTPRD